MAHPKFSALSDQVTHRRLAHVHKYQRSFRTGLESAPVQEPKQLGIFPGPAELEVFHQYDPKTREVEWAYYASDGRFLLQFGFSLVHRSYQIYSVHPGILRDPARPGPDSGQEEMSRFREAIQTNLHGHYPPLELAWETGKGPQIRRCEAE